MAPPYIETLERSWTVSWRPVVRLIRPHQWVKNVLLLVPALAAHLTWTNAVSLKMLSGFILFSLTASAVYVLNDIVDAAHDRRHPTKCTRPIAAYQVTVPSALGVLLTLLIGTGALLVLHDPQFVGIVATYLVVTTAYSFVLKRMVLVDVFALVGLYLVRLLAGAILADVPLSGWFVAFFAFFFTSIALVKRIVELNDSDVDHGELLSGRGYSAADTPVLLAFGVACAAAATLVYCLYITGDSVTRLYGRPEILWCGFPVVLYWMSRLWLLTMRGDVHEDPILFAVHDRASYACVALLGAIVFFAA
jgi:4-hydroxybenzoate polyprenyltransferase